MHDIRMKSEVDDKSLEERIQFAVDKIYSRLKT
jgi:hypothetical protein